MFQHLSSYIIGTFVALFPIANPFGAVPIFYSLTATDTPAYRLRQARKVAINVIAIGNVLGLLFSIRETGLMERLIMMEAQAWF
ncbi:MAG: hypothetical protein DCF22_18425 [Leptolyngbya sp.]|nr:MAG: hypothetical protein DCF22_18425 [Leptolyngbya sp.]